MESKHTIKDELPCMIRATPNDDISSYEISIGYTQIGCTYNDLEESESEGNALLIANAFNTTNSCGLLPSELLKQRDELLEALKKLYNAYGSCVDITPELLQSVSKTIQSCTK